MPAITVITEENIILTKVAYMYTVYIGLRRSRVVYCNKIDGQFSTDAPGPCERSPFVPLCVCNTNNANNSHNLPVRVLFTMLAGKRCVMI